MSLLAQATTATGPDVIIDQSTSLYKIVDLGLLIQRVFQVGILLIGVIILAYLVWGGVDWILAGNDKGKVDAARSKITQGIIGLALFTFVFVIYFILANFLGLGNHLNISGNVNGGGTGGGGGTGASTCSGNVAIGATVNDGGSGGYCSGGGAAMVKCVGPGVGPSQFSYAHYEPCSCVTGTLLPGYLTSGCQ